MKNFENHVLNVEDLSLFKGGLTKAEFLESLRWLDENGHHEQYVAVMKMYNAGMIEFEDGGQPVP